MKEPSSARRDRCFPPGFHPAWLLRRWRLRPRRRRRRCNLVPTARCAEFSPAGHAAQSKPAQRSAHSAIAANAHRSDIAAVGTGPPATANGRPRRRLLRDSPSQRHCSDVRHGVQEVKPYVDKASFAIAMLLALDGDKEWEATGAEHGIKLFRKPCACALLRARACASGCRRNDTPNLQTRRACARCGACDGCAAT